MKILKRFIKAAKKATEIGAKGGIYSNDENNEIQLTEEYDKAVKESHELFIELTRQGINPLT